MKFEAGKNGKADNPKVVLTHPCGASAEVRQGTCWRAALSRQLRGAAEGASLPKAPPMLLCVASRR